eukprot:CFRG4529T1
MVRQILWKQSCSLSILTHNPILSHSRISAKPSSKRYFQSALLETSAGETKTTAVCPEVNVATGLGQGVVFREGELVFLTEKNVKRPKTVLDQLSTGRNQRSHAGVIGHNEIIGTRVGGVCKTHKGKELLVTRPTLEQYVETGLKRCATPTYPKDAMTMMFMLDLAPGMRVLEAGSGSGGLSLFLSRCVGESGKVVSVEKRLDHSCRAQSNYNLWANANGWPTKTITWHVGDMSAGNGVDDSDSIANPSLLHELTKESFDGVALDMPEPGPNLSTVARVLKPGRSVVCYLPNITQVLQTLSTIKDEDLPLKLNRTVECNLRRWTFEPNTTKATKGTRVKEMESTHERPNQLFIARPSHDQDTHTAFLVQLTKTT